MQTCSSGVVVGVLLTASDKLKNGVWQNNEYLTPSITAISYMALTEEQHGVEVRVLGSESKLRLFGSIFLLEGIWLAHRINCAAPK